MRFFTDTVLEVVLRALLLLRNERGCPGSRTFFPEEILVLLFSVTGSTEEFRVFLLIVELSFLVILELAVFTEVFLLTLSPEEPAAFPLFTPSRDVTLRVALDIPPDTAFPAEVSSAFAAPGDRVTPFANILSLSGLRLLIF